jgi:uncharacterized protein YdeI (YjbR/CyaY-like superfamily)
MSAVDAYIARFPQDAIVLSTLRRTMLSEGLSETIKWGIPVFTSEGVNIAGIASFKSYIGIWFFNGAAIDDYMGVLVNAQEGKTVSQRQWRFQRGDVLPAKDLKKYIRMAVSVGASQTKRQPKAEIIIPAELMSMFAENKGSKTQFDKLPPSHQREYCNYISEAKKSETRVKRAEKVIGMLVNGVGLNDKYTRK